MSDAMVGTITSGFYSNDHPSRVNQEYVSAFRQANPNLHPNFISVSAYDGMHLIDQALAKTGGRTDGDLLIGVMKGMSWDSPRGPISIDSQTRDVVHDIYLRRVEKIDGELRNVEFATVKSVKDPIKSAGN